MKRRRAGGTAGLQGAWAAVLALGALSAAPASAQQVPRSSGPPALAVPFVPQSERLCGGAALAMVERYWGRTGVHAEDFAHLVRPELAGITTGDLRSAARDRGWLVVGPERTPAAIRRALDDRVPVVALLEERPGRYHYVVVVAWPGDSVVYHDPARGPARTVTEIAFLAAWDAAERWTMLLLPPDSATTRVARAAPAPAERSPDPPATRCARDVADAVGVAQAGALDRAAGMLESARVECPNDDVIVLELAGIRFGQRRLGEAVVLAETYVAGQPDDTYGWELLAASRYLADDRTGALEAWYRAGRGQLDLIRIDGLARTRYTSVRHALALTPGAPLTPARLSLAERRLADIPAMARASVHYRPVAGGQVEVRAATTERRFSFAGWPQVVRVAARALVEREIVLELPSPVGGGELVAARGRIDPARPHAVLSLASPADFGVPGVVTLAGSWERRRFALDTAGGVLIEERRSGRAAYAAWLTGGLRTSVGIRLDRWSGGTSSAELSTAAEARLAGDRLTVRLEGSAAVAAGTGAGYRLASLQLAWRSSTEPAPVVWSARAGVAAASAGAPLSTWPLAGSDVGEVIALRAHPVSRAGAIPGAQLARHIPHGGAAVDWAVATLGPAALGFGGFLDAAWFRAAPYRPHGAPWLVDAGGGLRLGLNGTTLRLDLAHGLSDGSTAISLGLHTDWPAVVRR